MTDIIYCSSTATFSQPEVKLGIIPGAGGSQRLTNIIGKSRAMDLIMTGRSFSGVEAEKWGVAARCLDSADECVNGAVDTAGKMAGMSRVAIRAAKEVVNKSQDLSLREGVEYERKTFHGLFGSKDQKIGTCRQCLGRTPRRLTLLDQAWRLSQRRKSHNGHMNKFLLSVLLSS